MGIVRHRRLRLIWRRGEALQLGSGRTARTVLPRRRRGARPVLGGTPTQWPPMSTGAVVPPGDPGPWTSLLHGKGDRHPHICEFCQKPGPSDSQESMKAVRQPGQSGADQLQRLRDRPPCFNKHDKQRHACAPLRPSTSRAPGQQSLEREDKAAHLR